VSKRRQYWHLSHLIVDPLQIILMPLGGLAISTDHAVLKRYTEIAPSQQNIPDSRKRIIEYLHGFSANARRNATTLIRLIIDVYKKTDLKPARN
jgi:hypothetical protein